MTSVQTIESAQQQYTHTPAAGEPTAAFLPCSQRRQRCPHTSAQGISTASNGVHQVVYECHGIDCEECHLNRAIEKYTLIAQKVQDASSQWFEYHCENYAVEAFQTASRRAGARHILADMQDGLNIYFTDMLLDSPDRTSVRVRSGQSVADWVFEQRQLGHIAKVTLTRFPQEPDTLKVKDDSAQRVTIPQDPAQMREYAEECGLIEDYHGGNMGDGLRYAHYKYAQGVTQEIFMQRSDAYWKKRKLLSIARNRADMLEREEEKRMKRQLQFAA